MNQLNNDIKDVNEQIRVDSSLSNNIQWDTLLYIVEEESTNRVTSESIQTKDKVTNETKKSIINSRRMKVRDISDSSQPVFSTDQSVAGK